jgi:hypothetical protein
VSESRCSLESMSPLFRKRREDETGSIAPKGHNSSLTRQIATFINTIVPNWLNAAARCPLQSIPACASTAAPSRSFRALVRPRSVPVVVMHIGHVRM